MNLSRKEILEKISELSDTEKINAYFENYKDLPKQGSEAWIKDRKIGGSAVATILGVNKFSSKEQLIKSLTSPEDSQIESIAMNWGTVFEEAAKYYLNNFIKIVEFGSLPGFALENGKIVTSYSPDGLFVFTRELYDSDLCEFNENDINKAFLLEIKCPFMRKITGEIPSYYVPQIQLGLHTIEFTQKALYTEFAFRICSLSDLNFSSSCSNFGNTSIFETPLAIGFYGFDLELESSIITEDIEVDFPNIERSNFKCAGAYLRKLESIYTNMSEVVKFKHMLQLFEHDILVEIFRFNYPEFSGVDLGSTLNFLYNSPNISPDEIMSKIKTKIKEDNFYLSHQLYSQELTKWECRDFFNNEIKKSGSKSLLCYKLFQIEGSVIEKKNFDSELEQILKFGSEIFN